MIRNSLLLAGIVATLLLPMHAAADSLPNIVVILTDDQGFADISLNPLHADEVSTPHMDSLAEAGVVFSQAYTTPLPMKSNCLTWKMCQQLIAKIY